MWRIGLGMVAGVVAGVLVIACVQTAGHALFPAPPGIDLSTPEAIRANIHLIPAAAIAAVGLAWASGAFVGGFAAARIALRVWPAYAIGALVFAAALYNMMTLPHPVWMWVFAPAGIAAGAWLAGKLSAEARKTN